MRISDYLLIAGGVFGLCWLVDKAFTKAFRSAPQHGSGKSVRLNKHFGGAGICVAVLGILGLLAGQGWIVMAAGVLLLTVGGTLIVYYMTFGVYYDRESFLLTSFSRRNTNYRYGQIKGQQLYFSGGRTIIELHMDDGRTVQLQSGMTGVYPFLDTAFAGWCTQKNIPKESCGFHDPDNSCWFPAMEE